MDLDDLRVDVYRAYLEDVNDLREDRQKYNSLYVTVATVLLGAQAFVASTPFGSTLARQIVNISLSPAQATLGAVVIGVVGVYFCINWLRLIRNYGDSLRFKYKNLKAMEANYPVLQDAGARLFTAEDEDRNTRSGEAGKGGNKSRTSRRTTRNAEDLARFFRVLFVVIPLIPFATLVAQLPSVSALVGPVVHTVLGR